MRQKLHLIYYLIAVLILLLILGIISVINSEKIQSGTNHINILDY